MVGTSTGEGRAERGTKGDMFLKSVHGLSRYFLVIGEISLSFMMFLTVVDVIMRSFRKPIIGTYEIVGFSAAVAIGFSLPLTSWMKGHVFVDLFTAKMSPRARGISEYGNPVHRPGGLLPHRLAIDQVWVEPSQGERSLHDPTDAFLSRCLGSRSLRLHPMFGDDQRHRQNRSRDL